MHLTNTKVAHENGGWLGDDGDAVTVHVADAAYIDEEAAVERARAIMVQLTGIR
ncbi:YjbH domain-containing protein [Rhizobium gallicum]|uniref:YjbH domain-containing protein n=1 Tax=Rhizobium gallicum TaxID=56730 RepID=UPI001EF86879|nr:YjbH domain-containing protein [Rhizobium gallicum]ULJ72580.1 YjbH domain-containing protein [Rhizobium gallicum]